MAIERGDATWIEVFDGAWIKPDNQTDATLSRDKDTIETTSKDSSGWKQNIDGFRGWSMSVTCIYNESDSGHVAIKAAYEANTNMNVRFFDGTAFQTGLSIATALEITGPLTDAKQYTATFTGDGALT